MYVFIHNLNCIFCKRNKKYKDPCAPSPRGLYFCVFPETEDRKNDVFIFSLSSYIKNRIKIKYFTFLE